MCVCVCRSGAASYRCVGCGLHGSDWCAFGHSHDYGYADCHCDGNRYSDRDGYSYPDAYGDGDSVMPLGDTFNSLGQPGPSNAPAPDQPPVGGALSNDHVKEAVKTNPVQAAHIKVEMSKANLKSLAMRMKQAQNGL